MRVIWWVIGSVLAAVLAMTGSPALGQTPPSSGLGIRLLEGPADRKDDPRASVYIVDHVQPGESLSRRFEVVNGTPRPARIALYPAAGELARGTFNVLPGRGENELTDWMRITPSSLDLGPGQAAQATVTIDVPPEAGGGERYAAVMAEVVEAGAQPGVSVTSRVGIRTYLSVGGPKEPASDFEVSTLQAVRQADGRPAVRAQVRNTGGRALDMSGALRLANGPGGLSAGPFPAELGTTLAPGEQTPVTVVLDKAISGGPWEATLALRSGRVERAAKATLTFPDDAGAQEAPVAASAVSPAEDPRIVVPIAVALVLGALALLGGTVLRRRFRGRGRPAGDALQD